MIRVAAKPPNERAAMSELVHILMLRAVNQWRQRLSYDELPKLRAWGLRVNDQMMEVSARVLPPPMVVYKTGSSRAANG